MKNKNLILFYAQATAYNCVILIAVGTIFQTFMLECGIDEAKVSICVSAVQVVQTIITLLTAKLVENIKNVLNAIAFCLSFQLLPLVVMLILCFATGISVDTKYYLLFGSGIILSLFLGPYTVLSYKQPHHIMKISEYGKACGQSGVITGLFGILITTLIALALKKFSYFGTMAVVCVFGIIMALVSVLTNFAFTRLDPAEQGKMGEKINIFRYKPFYQLLIPNFMRGLSNGVLSLVPVIGYYCGILDKSSTAVLATLAQIATLINCQTYVFIASKKLNGIIALISSVIMLIAMPLMPLGNSATWFLIIYFIAFFFNFYIANAVPVIIAENIDYNCMGQYTAWRMALFTGGTSIGGFLVPLLLDSIGGIGTLFVGGLAMLPCGLGYYLFDKQNKKKQGS